MPAIPPHSSATTDAPWNGASEEAKLKSPITGSEARNFYAWRDAQGQDPDGDGWPDYKSAYKFGHHVVSDSGIGGAANVKACSSGIAVLNGGRGGSSIPSGDRAGVHEHLAKHLEAAGMKPPPLGASLAETLLWAVDAGVMEQDEAMEIAHEAPISLNQTRERAGLPAADRPLVPPQLLGHSFWAMREEDIGQVLELASRLPEKAFDALGGGGADVEVQGSVAVIPLSGMITPRASFLSMLFGGGGGLEGFRCAFREALNDSSVKKIVFDIDSPGGLVSLVPETAAEVLAARGAKPIVACVNTLAASAAYWIASAADQVVCTPSGMAGSIGVYKVHVDRSARNEAMGMVPTYIKAGKFKTEGNPDEPLGSDAKAHFQQNVDDLYSLFVEGVAKGRGVSPQAVANGYGEGRVLLAQRALEAGLIDDIGTLADVVGAAVEDERPEDDDDAEQPDEPDENSKQALIERRREHAKLLLGV
jgi:signal peptide peptidase SppA